jgi:hypothetical protein
MSKDIPVANKAGESMNKVENGTDPAEIDLDKLDNQLQVVVAGLLKLALRKNESERGKIASIHAINRILGIGMSCTTLIHQVLRGKASSGEHPHLVKHLQERATNLPVFPILFSETVDLAPYRELKIGYCCWNSQNPKIRSGKSAFSPYAKHLVLRLSWIRSEQRARSKGQLENFRASEAYKCYLEFEIPRRGTQWFQNMSEEEVKMRERIHMAQPENLEDVAKLPRFCKASSKQWAQIAKNFFKTVFPNPLELSSLAKAAMNPNLDYESQMRAQIVERIGRAVVALAPVETSRAREK